MPGTTFIDIICNHAMVEIDDVRLQKKMAESPARFFRTMAMYMMNAIPRFHKPPEAREWLKFTAPQYEDYQYTISANDISGETSTIAIPTGIKGYEICNAILMQPDGYGGTAIIPVETEYDADTGIATIRGAFTEGQMIDLDFYTDGVFDRTLGYDVMRILGLCVQLVWESRFVNAFLIQQPKIKDRSFDVGSEANHMRASTERLRELTARLNGELNAFEQDMEYNRVVLHNEPEIAAQYPMNPN